LTYVSATLTASIIRAMSHVALLMESVSTSETSISLYWIARRNIPEDSHLNTRRCKKVECQKKYLTKHNLNKKEVRKCKSVCLP
jgi:hypothetical protein